MQRVRSGCGAAGRRGAGRPCAITRRAARQPGAPGPRESVADGPRRPASAPTARRAADGSPHPRGPLPRDTPLLALALALAACTSVDVGGSDREAFFAAARVTKELDDDGDARAGPRVELSWRRADGETDELDDSIDVATLGARAAVPVGDRAGPASAPGSPGRRTTSTPETIDLDSDDGVGPYLAVEGGRRATDRLEPYARVEGELYLNEYATTLALEGGVRLHAIEHAAPFVGWRYARYNVDDVDAEIGISDVELDTIGLIVGLVLNF